MWASLKSIRLQKHPSPIFNAMDAFFSIRFQENESLTSLITGIDNAMYRIQSLFLASFTLADSDRGTQSMALIKALPDNYAAFNCSGAASYI